MKDFQIHYITIPDKYHINLEKKIKECKKKVSNLSLMLLFGAMGLAVTATMFRSYELDFYKKVEEQIKKTNYLSAEETKIKEIGKLISSPMFNEYKRRERVYAGLGIVSLFTMTFGGIGSLIFDSKRKKLEKELKDYLPL